MAANNFSTMDITNVPTTGGFGKISANKPYDSGLYDTFNTRTADTSTLGAEGTPLDYKYQPIDFGLNPSAGVLKLGGDTPDPDPGFLDGLGKWAENNKSLIGGALGLGELGLGLAGYFQNEKLMGKQMNLMDQQIASNKTNADNKATMISDLQRTRTANPMV